jgi:phosphotransferase system enzyme I (PtsI)
MPEEVVLSGLAVSKGIGIGTPVFFFHSEDDIPEISISRKEINREVDSYYAALEKSRDDLQRLRDMSLHEGPPEIVSILGAHLEMMQDPMMTTVVEEKIRNLQWNTKSVFHHLLKEYKKRFSTLQDTYFQERVQDITDVFRRVEKHLCPVQKQKLNEVPPGSIVLTHELVPSETVEAKAENVCAFVTAAGGITSHAAIIARAKGIPYVANIDIQIFKRLELKQLIVDGSQGLVIVNPTPETLKKYLALQRGDEKLYSEMKSVSKRKAETLDGYEVKVFANLENPGEIGELVKSGASGVGLFRSEYLFLSARSFPTEEEQFQIYKQMAVALKGKPLTVRVFDVGGDKKIDLLPEEKDAKYFARIGYEVNPALGCRAVRFLLRFPELLEAQLRAIIRASAFGSVQILLPMVTDLNELWQVRKVVDKIVTNFDAKGVKRAERIPVGCMIEVPSSALVADVLAQEADFLSIGTNDLIQYVLAADRNNPHTSGLYFSAHPSVLRLIKTVVAAANTARKPMLLCGEYAADPKMIPLLVGLGIRQLSVSARHIPLVKHTLRQWRIVDACRLAEGALDYASAGELKEYLAAETQR